MSYFARWRGRIQSRPRRVRSSCDLERLEPRALLSGAGGSGALPLHVPTTTLLKASNTSAETAEAVSFTAAVINQHTGKPVAGGLVKFLLDSPTPLVLGKVKIKHGEARLTTSKLTRLGPNVVEADFIPTSVQLAGASSAELTIIVTPLTVTKFGVTPEVRRGHPGEPMTFTVTALLADKKPASGYTGTVMVTSPTDSNTMFPPSAYVRLGISAPAPSIIGLATFRNQVYTFTPADHGTHTFTGGVTFGKGGAEVVKVTQVNNHRIRGFATFAIS
jgi:hypothetical protein